MASGHHRQRLAQAYLILQLLLGILVQALLVLLTLFGLAQSHVLLLYCLGEEEICKTVLNGLPTYCFPPLSLGLGFPGLYLLNIHAYEFRQVDSLRDLIKQCHTLDLPFLSFLLNKFIPEYPGSFIQD